MKIRLLKLNLPVIFLLAVFQFSSCSSPKKPPFARKPANTMEEKFLSEQTDRFEAVAADLERNRRLWQENNIVNYDFVFSRYAGGVDGWAPVLIKVREGKAVLVERAEKSDIAKIDGYETFKTIDKIFDYIQTELEAGRKVTVKYNQKFGYPEKVSIEYSYLPDNWRSMTITKFEVIK